MTDLKRINRYPLLIGLSYSFLAMLQMNCVGKPVEPAGNPVEPNEVFHCRGLKSGQANTGIVASLVFNNDRSKVDVQYANTTKADIQYFSMLATAYDTSNSAITFSYVSSGGKFTPNVESPGYLIIFSGETKQLHFERGTESRKSKSDLSNLIRWEMPGFKKDGKAFSISCELKN